MNERISGVAANEARRELAEARAEQAETRAVQAETRTERAEMRTEKAESRTQRAETRTEQAEMRTERAETRTEQAETRTELAVARAEQAETTLHLVADQLRGIPPQSTSSVPAERIADQSRSLEELNARQREILKLIAEGHNTKQIAAILELSPKTVEYHRLKMMERLNVHDIPGLVRFALRVGLIQQDS